MLQLLVDKSRERLAHPYQAQFWGALAANLILALTVGYFIHGGMHGLYMDDYSEKAWAFNFATATWKLNLNPLSHIRSLAHIFIANMANAIPKYEFEARLAVLTIHLLNVWLLGKLAHRLTNSLFLGIVTSAYFVFPIVANDAVIWFSTAIANTLSLSLLLIGFHCFLSCRSLRKDLPLFVCGVGAWTLTVLFYEPGLFTLLLLPAFMAMAYPGRTEVNRRISILALVASFFPIGMYMLFWERRAPEFAARGGAVLSVSFVLSHRVPEVFRALVWLVADWGLFGPLREALNLGSHEWLSTPRGWFLVIGFLVSGLLAVILFPVSRDTISNSQSLIRLFLIAFAWMLLSMVPTALVKSQEVSTRALYTPFAGFALGAAAISGLLVHLFGQWRQAFYWEARAADKDVSIRAILFIAGVVLFLCSLTTAGVVRAYELRWHLDQLQVDALGQVMPMLSRVEPVWLLPVTLDEKTVGNSGGPKGNLDRYLAGVFEVPWSARDAVRLKFGDRNIQAVTANRWAGLRVTSVDNRKGHASTVTIQGTAIPVEHLLAFTYKQGRIILLNPLDITDPADSHSSIIELPLAAQFERTGIKTEPAHFELEHQN